MRELSGDEVERIEGWGAIAAHVAERTGFTMSIDSVKRWSKRAEDALPVKRWGMGRPRVVADAGELDAWCDRQWVQDGPPDGIGQASSRVTDRERGERGGHDGHR